MKHLEINPHPACCGISNIGYWGFATTNINARGERPLHELEADLIQAEQLAVGGLALTTLNEEQIPHVEYLLEKHGWSPIVKNFGGNHGKATTLYGKILKKTPTSKIGALEYDGKNKRINNSTPRASTPSVEKPKVAAPIRTASVARAVAPIARRPAVKATPVYRWWD